MSSRGQESGEGGGRTVYLFCDFYLVLLDLRSMEFLLGFATEEDEASSSLHVKEVSALVVERRDEGEIGGHFEFVGTGEILTCSKPVVGFN